MVGWSVVCECAWSEVWLGSVVCVRVHECGFVMECRTANPSPSVAVSLVHLAAQPFTEWPFYVKHLVHSRLPPIVCRQVEGWPLYCIRHI